MCNIAGYAGTKPAAPILIDMIRKQEGLDAGFYTGIATIHEGKIYYAKAVGDLDHLLETTNAASLPGTVGIMHSCTPNDCGDEWAHPFVCERDGEVFSAYIANGWVGCFEHLTEGFKEIAEELLADGYQMRTRVPSNGNLLTLSDNTRVHQSDVMCQSISRRIVKGASTVDAMREAFLESPKEIVGLLLSVAEPDAITWGRVNFPMHVGSADHGMYMATAPLAFPEDAAEPYLLPVWSSGLVNKDGFTCRSFGTQPAKVAPLTPRVKAGAYEAVRAALLEGHKKQTDLGKYVKPLFEEADCQQTAAAVYGALSDIYKRENLKIETEYLHGVFEGLKAPKFYMTLEE